MKSDFSRRFYGQVLVNILYSTLVACLVEIFLIANVDMIVNYLEKTQGSLSPALKIFRMGTATTILYVIAGIGIFSLTFLLLQRKSIRYIGKIAAAIQNISEGDLNIQVEVEGDDEFAMMAASLNRMEADIRELMDKERESERTKNELITNVAHDLRTPLTSIINYVDLIKREKPQDPTIQKYLEVLDQKSQRLKTLTEDLVEASRASSGNIKLDMANIDIVELVQQTNGEFEEKYAIRHLDIVTTLPNEVILIEADGRRLWRVLENLYNNAFKYAMEGTRVYVGIEDRDSEVVFSIKNVSATPLNISPDELTERFVRGDTSRTTEGSGLGLSIAKDLTQLQGGRFEITIDGDLFKAELTFAIKN